MPDGPYVCPPDHKHGDTGTCYAGHGCRCSSCRQWNTDQKYYWRHMSASGRLRPTFTPVTGTMRRLRALQLAGYGQRDLARMLHVSQARISMWILGTVGSIRVGNAEAVATLFSQLWDKPGPSARARYAARKRGYMPALAWDDIDDPAAVPDLGRKSIPLDEYMSGVDEVAVSLAMSGEKPRLHPGEVRECVRMLHARTWGDVRIAEWLGMSARQIGRVRRGLGLDPWDAEQVEARSRVNW